MVQKKHWREMYIGILLNGPDKSEYKFAAELIDDGYGNGRYIKNSEGSGDPIAHLHWTGPTTKGREYLDDLQTKVRRNSFVYRIWSGIVIFLAWLLGLLTDVLVQWLGNT